MLRPIALLVLAVVLAGCVAGQNIKLQYQPGPPRGSTAVSSGAVFVTVSDQRSYVTSGNKEPSYLGHYRGGFGNTWDVMNYKDVALADQMRSDIWRELASLGFKEAGQGAEKTIAVVIHEWNFDANINGRVWFDVAITVVAADGRQLATARVKDEKIVKGSVMTGAKGAMEEQVPAIYGEVIRRLLRDAPMTLAALSR